MAVSTDVSYSQVSDVSYSRVSGVPSLCLPQFFI